ncbi:hypothetical protein LXL04_026984 [Taraxacum kok-saghyz]
MHKKKVCTYAKFLEKKKSFFRNFFFATGLIFERFLAPRSRFFEKVNGLGVLGLDQVRMIKIGEKFATSILDFKSESESSLHHFATSVCDIKSDSNCNFKSDSDSSLHHRCISTVVRNPCRCIITLAASWSLHSCRCIITVAASFLSLHHQTRMLVVVQIHEIDLIFGNSFVAYSTMDVSNEESSAMGNNEPGILVEPKPEDGLKFRSYHEAYVFYKDYAKKAGFEVRKSTTIKMASGVGYSHKYVVCAKEGKKAKVAMPTIIYGKNRPRNRPSPRMGCKAMIKVKFIRENFNLKIRIRNYCIMTEITPLSPSIEYLFVSKPISDSIDRRLESKANIGNGEDGFNGRVSNANLASRLRILMRKFGLRKSGGFGRILPIFWNAKFGRFWKDAKFWNAKSCNPNISGSSAIDEVSLLK